MLALTHSHPAARARRDRYCALRREGMKPWDAVREAGASPDSAPRYERWFLALERGETLVPGKPGRPKRAVP